MKKQKICNTCKSADISEIIVYPYKISISVTDKPPDPGTWYVILCTSCKNKINEIKKRRRIRRKGENN